MPITFVESMRGSVTPQGGGEAHPLCFHVEALGGQGGRFRLSGVVHASPWAEEAVAEGTLELSLLPPRIAYEVGFTSDTGQRLRLHGAKRPSPLRLLSSMTVLEITLETAEGTALARGTLRFDLLELPEFAASWLSVRSRAARQLRARRVAVARRDLPPTAAQSKA